MSAIDPRVIRKLGDNMEQDTVHVTRIAFKESSYATNKECAIQRYN